MVKKQLVNGNVWPLDVARGRPTARKDTGQGSENRPGNNTLGAAPPQLLHANRKGTQGSRRYQDRRARPKEAATRFEENPSRVQNNGNHEQGILRHQGIL
jgi:hypothetical protein